MRYVIKFSKESDIKFVSYLDIMRTMQRTIKRAGLPIDYSKGFNPHMNLSIAQPLPVGVYSKSEYADIVLKEEVEESKILEALQCNAPVGLKFLKVIKVNPREDAKKIPQIMALLEAATYEIKIKYDDTSKLKEELDALMEVNEFEIVKKSKKGDRVVDIKPFIKTINFEIEDNILKINTLVSCGSAGNLSAELLSEYITTHTSNVSENKYIDILRKEMFTTVNDKLDTVEKYFS